MKKIAAYIIKHDNRSGFFGRGVNCTDERERKVSKAFIVLRLRDPSKHTKHQPPMTIIKCLPSSGKERVKHGKDHIRWVWFQSSGLKILILKWMTTLGSVNIKGSTQFETINHACNNLTFREVGLLVNLCSLLKLRNNKGYCQEQVIISKPESNQHTSRNQWTPK